MSDDMFIDMGSVEHVRAVDAPGEVGEIELMRLADLIKCPTTVGVFAVVVQRPVEEIPARLQVHQQFVPIRTDTGTLLEIVVRAVKDIRLTISEIFESPRSEEHDA